GLGPCLEHEMARRVEDAGQDDLPIRWQRQRHGMFDPGVHTLALLRSADDLRQERSVAAALPAGNFAHGGPAVCSSLCLAIAATLLLRRLQLLQIEIEAIEALVPEAAIAFEPAVDVLERSRFDPARPPLRFAAAHDQAGALQHLEMLGDGGA